MWTSSTYKRCPTSSSETYQVKEWCKVFIEVKLDVGDDEEMLNYFAQVIAESDGTIVRVHLNQVL
jgi:hypothetical protein